MSNIKINGKEFNDLQIVKLQKGKTDEAISKLNSGKQGADDVVFKVGDDVFVASGRGMFDGKKAAGRPFMGGEGITLEVDGKKAEVIAWDNQANNGKECATWASKYGLVVPFAGVISGDMFAKLGLKGGVLVGAIGWLATVGGAFVYGTSRKMNMEELTTMGSVVQQNSQSKGGWGDAIKNLFTKN